MSIKPQVIIAGLVVLVLLGLMTSLRKVSDKPEREGKEVAANMEDLEQGNVRVSRIDAPSTRMSSEDQATASRAPIKKSGPRKQLVEDFEMAKKRAEGDSVITGRIFADTREPGSDQDRGGFGRWGGRDRDDRTSDSGRRGGSDGPGGPGGRFGGPGGPGSPDGPGGPPPAAGFGWLGGGPDGATATADSQTSRPAFGSAEFFARSNMKPVENAEISLYEGDPNTTHPALRTVVTDKEGSFTIAGVNGADQRYMLISKADGFAPEADFVHVRDSTEQVFMRMEKGVPLRGKVLDAISSQPVAGAVVYQPNSRWEASSALGVTTTSVTGEFYFPNTASGRNVTQARADGYATARARVRAPDEESIIQMQPGGSSISGVTLDRLTGKPQGGAKVIAQASFEVNESVMSAADGTFKIPNLPAGEYEIYALRGMKSESVKFELAKNEKKEDVELMMPAELLVSGQVINTKDRSPMQGVKVWFNSTKGAQYRKTNSDGRFSFETMAIDEYSILIHEKGFLPVQDKKSTDIKETITRKVAKNQSSDELTIRLKPVPTVAGTVTGQGRRGNGEQPINDANVTLAFEDGRDFYQLKTQSDEAGNFFINLPNGERGRGIIVGSKDFALDTAEIRAPREKPVNLKLERNLLSAQVLLSDESALDGIRVEVSKSLSESRQDSGLAHKVTVIDLDTMRGGRLFGPLPKNTQVDLTFHLPDGNKVSKSYQTNKLINSRPTFVYDPVSQDIVEDMTRQNRSGDWGRWGNRGQDGNGNSNGPRQGQNNGGNGNGNGRQNNPAVTTQ